MRQTKIVALVAAGFCIFSPPSIAVLFEPGIGVGSEYTNNANLAQENKKDDLVLVGYVGARVTEDEGALTYSATGASNSTVYTKDTFADQRYLSLSANAKWEMIKERFNWFLSDIYTQRAIVALDGNTPQNLQNTNRFNFGANISFPISARQRFTLVPSVSQYYYNQTPTDNNQVSLAASWNYALFRLMSVGFNLSSRRVDYTSENALGQSIEDTVFTNAAIVFSGQRVRSIFSANLGATSAKRKNGKETTAFAGFFSWLVDLSSRSKFETQMSTDLTDAGSVAFTSPVNPGAGNDDSVQVTTDVIRNSYVYMAYLRDDSSLKTEISARYRDVKYSENVALNREIGGGSLRFSYPLSPLLSSGAYMDYNRVSQVEVDRLDKRLSVGTNFNYVFSRKVRGLLDFKYRRSDSTLVTRTYKEYSVFVSLIYGFGDVNRPTRTGGF